MFKLALPLLALSATRALGLGRHHVSSSVRNLSMIDKRACFGAGCYWGTEKFFKSDFGTKYYKGIGKVTKGKVGFMSALASATPNPTYKEVCSGQTGFVEVYDLSFEGEDLEKTYESLCRHFFTFHDPTTFNRQGNDRGTQYASAIFCYDSKQKEIATKVMSEFQALMSKTKHAGYSLSGVETAIEDAAVFYAAEDYHQDYLNVNPGGYCNHGYRIEEW